MTDKFFSLEFEDDDKKKAFRKATNWIAKNVMSKSDDDKITYRIEFLKGKIKHTFKVHLYCSLDITEEQNRFCEVCKKYHKSFFINQEYNCNACKVKAYHSRVDERMSIVRTYRKEKIRYQINKGE